MAVTATYYVPDSSGSSLSNLSAKFRIRIDQSYDPVTNRSTLTLIPQVFCTSQNYPPSGLVFMRDNLASGLVADVQVDGSTVGSIASTNVSSSSGRMTGASTTLNTWVGLKLGGRAYTMSTTVTHGDGGSKTITVAIGRLWAQDSGFTYNGTCGATSKSVPISQSRSFTLSVSAGTGSTISVSRNGTPLSDGASVDYGDVLTITFAANTGYNLVTHTVNGSTFTSGGTITVTNAVAVVSTAAKKSYTLTIDRGPNSTIKVTRNGSTLSDGATVYYGDQLAITMTASDGHHLTTSTVSGASKSGSYYVVSGNVKVKTVAEGNDKTLYIRAAEGVSVSVTKNGTALSNNADIAVDDVLTITATAATGYENATVTVTGATQGSGNNYTVTDNVTVTPSATKRHFTLAISPATGSSISVMRGSERLSDGDTIYYGDALVISAVPDSGYGILTLTVNGSPFANGATHVVSAAVTVATTTEELVGAYLRLAAEWLRYALYINSIVNGWGRYVSYIQTITGWVKY